MFSQRVLSTLLAVVLLGSEPGAALQGKPEFFGFYAVDNGKLLALAGGRSDNPTPTDTIALATLGDNQPVSRRAVRVGRGARFILFDASPGDAIRALTFHRLPFVGREITVPESTLFGGSSAGTQSRTVDRHGLMRLSAGGISRL